MGTRSKKQNGKTLAEICQKICLKIKGGGGGGWVAQVFVIGNPILITSHYKAWLYDWTSTWFSEFLFLWLSDCSTLFWTSLGLKGMTSKVALTLR